ncbi:hypothetical protein HDU90_003471 [Geranomyces variabilis]|nr:hypothetical protein HDU90_003471 [Geranomyces variabilis]
MRTPTSASLSGDTAFLVHTLFLKRNSEYFEACFRGPWDENTVNVQPTDKKGDSGLRQVTLGDVNSNEFSRLLDWIYRTDMFLDPEQALALVNIADRLQVGNLLAFLNHLAPPALTWENIEKWLNIATEGTRRFEQCIKSCTDFLQNAQASLWIRALYLAEKHNLGSLHGADNVNKLRGLHLPVMPYFELLSVPLQRDLLLAYMKKVGRGYTW